MVESCLIPAAFDRLASVAGVDSESVVVPEVVADLREYLARVPDPRARRGVRHSVESLLGLAAAAVLAGARSFAAIGEWIADVPQRVLAVLGARFDTRHGRYQAPEESTVRRLTQQVDGDLLDAAISGWLVHHTAARCDVVDQTALTAVAVDGKSLRGTFPRTGGAGVHLLAAITHTTGDTRTDGIVLGQRQVEQKTSEIAWFAPFAGPDRSHRSGGHRGRPAHHP